MKIRVSIADDHPLIISGLIQIFQDCEDIAVIATYTDGRELLKGLADIQPDVLLLDLHMPHASGEEVAPVILETYKGIKIIALTNQDNTYYVKTMMRLGVSGYVLKTSGADVIIEAIRAVYGGDIFIDPLLKERLVQETLHAKKTQASLPQLTRREKEVLDLIASNFTSQEIADKLFLSKRTIDIHRQNLLLKMEVKNSAALVKKAMQLGLLNQ